MAGVLIHGLGWPGQALKGASPTGICIASISIRTAFFLMCHFMVIRWTLKFRISHHSSLKMVEEGQGERD